jgi:hypothetical protein
MLFGPVHFGIRDRSLSRSSLCSFDPNWDTRSQSSCVHDSQTCDPLNSRNLSVTVSYNANSLGQCSSRPICLPRSMNRTIIRAPSRVSRLVPRDGGTARILLAFLLAALPNTESRKSKTPFAHTPIEIHLPSNHSFYTHEVRYHLRDRKSLDRLFGCFRTQGSSSTSHSLPIHA